MTDSAHTQHPLMIDYDELPETLPVFPLRRVILLPDIPLPLNVFEPRYLTMILDALTNKRLVGIVQPLRLEELNEDCPPPLAPVGCVGKIESFAETEDGRLLISLVGICRFRIEEEIPQGTKPYRRVKANYTPYVQDMLEPADMVLDIERMKEEFAPYLKKKDCAIDWPSISTVPAPLTVDYLSSHLPFTPEEKQVLLEADDHATRLRLLRGFAQMDASAPLLMEEASHAKH